MSTTYSEVWDLESIFPGGSDSKAFQDHLKNLTEMTTAFSEKMNQFQTPHSKDQAEIVAEQIENAKNVIMNLRQAGAFVSCLEAQNMADKQANVLRSQVTTLSAQFSTAFNTFQQKLAASTDQVWKGLLQHPALSELEFVLEEWRKKATDKLSEQEEALIESLSVDGYHGWGQMYDTIVGSMTIPFTLDGEEKELSVGQANNLGSHSDPKVRKKIFEKLEKAWGEKEELFAKTLNHLAGFRLNVYEKRGWDHVLKEPLEYNRMQQDTLDAMWGAITKHKGAFVKYLNRKAELLGKEKLDWYDLNAPISSEKETLSYEQGAKFILKHFEKFGPEMAQFAEKAFDGAWIEAEDRPGKRPGGFCTSFPLSEESRIFMTYSGSMSNVATLAHELGHAFHSHTLKPMHPLNRSYAMNVAETASTFAEAIVADAAVKEASSEEQQKSLLEDKLQRSVAMFMNIHSRFLFETRFYEERKNGVVPASRLNELMVDAQQEAYGGAINEAHPRFWASKLHFYITGVPFYNFPYTFGYLFSLSIYAKAIEEGTDYEEKYMALLRDTAIMSVEELAMKHLGEDITQEAFWEKGINLCVQDAETFLKLTK
ncbi:M3 family oligoendopeptidase [Salinibacillus xinjiangensis]|uniref:M3 family oligoendopeptidase n=1 Tax=Salinibacillus xinjiangensis TaxID=1229268 RepID=A0A6G1X8H9_9BACI|nr:M3 family oligoendopeptidase [Salinibacillus xinjiangensis]MRG87239.1 M3 family oligoendopeptidase [Salinibacillus xinjiangensis]